MSLTAAKQYVEIIKKEFADNDTELQFMYNYSDRSSKDFSCSSFLACLTSVLEENGIKGSWDFTCPEEGTTRYPYI